MKDQMKNENDLDEVIFEKRNKEYGAYYLRKTYDKNVSRALTITTTLLLLVVVIPLIANYIKDDRFFRIGPAQGPDVIVLDDPKDEPPPLPPPPPPPEVITEKVRFVVPTVGEDSTDQGVFFTQAELNELGNNDKITDTFLRVIDDPKEKKIFDLGKDDEILNLTNVSEKPYFPGGDEGFNTFITENTKYPDLARENKIQGTVYIKFVVEKDGTIDNIRIQKGIGAGCDEEAERVIKLMPKWTPGKQNNKNVRVEILVPMKFMVMQF